MTNQSIVLPVTRITGLLPEGQMQSLNFIPLHDLYFKFLPYSISINNYKQFVFSTRISLLLIAREAKDNHS